MPFVFEFLRLKYYKYKRSKNGEQCAHRQSLHFRLGFLSGPFSGAPKNASTSFERSLSVVPVLGFSCSESLDVSIGVACRGRFDVDVPIWISNQSALRVDIDHNIYSPLSMVDPTWSEPPAVFTDVLDSGRFRFEVFPIVWISNQSLSSQRYQPQYVLTYILGRSQLIWGSRLSCRICRRASFRALSFRGVRGGWDWIGRCAIVGVVPSPTVWWKQEFSVIGFICDTSRWLVITFPRLSLIVVGSFVVTWGHVKV